MQEVEIADVNDVPDNRPLAVEIEGIDVVLVRNGNGFSLFQGRCPHMGTLLREGSIESGYLVCKAHAWRFSCKDGARLRDPQTRLKRLDIRQSGERIVASKAELEAWIKVVRDDVNEPAATPISIKPMEDLPGPKALPGIGNLHQLEADRLHLILEDWRKDYGDIYRIQLMNEPAFVISDIKIIKELLRDRPENVRRVSTLEDVLSDIGAHGIISSEGDHWRIQRKIVAFALGGAQVRGFYPRLKDLTEKLKDRWTAAAKSDSVLDIPTEMMRYTVDVTSNVAFGYDLNEATDDGAGSIQEHLENVMPVMNHRMNFPVPYWRYVKFPHDRRIDEDVTALRSKFDEIVAASRSRLAKQNGGAVAENLLETMLLDQQKPESKLTDQDVFGNIFSLLLAGEETTGNTTAWVIYYLSRHRRAAERVRQEADEVFGDHDVMPDFEMASKLPYLTAVIKEAMRLKNVTPAWPMETLKDLEVKGFAIPANTKFFMLTRTPMLEDDEGFPAWEFDPDRWLPGAPKAAHFESLTIPFGSGPRRCPGSTLAMTEIKAVVSMIVKSFDLLPVNDGTNAREVFAFTVAARDIELRLRERGRLSPTLNRQPKSARAAQPEELSEVQ
ncbi:MAG: cytochrome P450 [Pseudomonadota bacterium]